MTDNAELKTLRHKRGALKAQLTIFYKHLNNLEINNLTQTEKENLRMRKVKIEPLYKTFNEVQANI